MRLTIRSGPAAGGGVDLDRRIVVGRDPSCGLVLDDEKASRQHAAVTRHEDGRVTLEDLGSTNGTYVDGHRIDGSVDLTAAELVQIGDTVIGLERPATRGTPTALEAAPAAQSAPPAADAGAAPTPSVIERIALRRSLRRVQVVAIVAGAGVLIALAVVLLFVTGVFGGEEEQPSAAEIIETVTPSTVQIRGEAPDGTTFGLGTGWVWDAGNGLVVTNSHVATAATKLTVILGQETRLRPATVVGIGQCDDLAVLKVADATGMETIPLGTQGDLAQGDTVIALGYPLTLADGDPLIITEGVASVVRTRTASDPLSQVYPNVIQTDAVINPGNSGGPLVDTDAKLIGVNTLKNTTPGVEGQFFAIGVDRVKEVVPRLVDGHSIGWPGMSFGFSPAPELLESLGLPAEPGLLVNGAFAGTFAESHGWNDGPFLLLAIDGRPIDGSWRSYCDAVGGYEEGEQATFTVVASGTSATQDVDVPFE